MLLASEYCSSVTDGTHDSPKQQEDGRFLITSRHLGRYALDYANAYKISEEDYQKVIKRSAVEQWDILISMIGTIGNIYIEKNADVCYACKNVGIFKMSRDVYKAKWLYYYLQSPKAQQYISALSRGTTQGYVPLGALRNFPIDVVDDLSRNRIVDLLWSIDEIIETKYKINDNLEQQALALFKSFFIDYEPYGGEIPTSWKKVSLGEVCTKITDGSHYSPVDSPDSPYPMYSVKDMETYGFNDSSCKHIMEDEFRKMQKNDCVPLLNDILVAKDGSYLKEIFICSEQKEEAILSSIAIFRPNTNIIIPEILLYLLKQPSVRKDVGDNYVSGSALPRIVLKDFKKYVFNLPPMEEQIKIGPVLQAIRMQNKANIDEIKYLSSLRDVLLPGLMSGEIDVSDIAV